MRSIQVFIAKINTIAYNVMEYIDPETKQEQKADLKDNGDLRLRQVAGLLIITSILSAIFAPLSVFSHGLSILVPIAVTSFLGAGFLYLIILVNSTDKNKELLN